MFKFGKEDLNSRGELEGDFLLKLDQGEVNKALKAFTDSVNDWVMDNADEKNDKFTNDNLKQAKPRVKEIESKRAYFEIY